MALIGMSHAQERKNSPGSAERGSGAAVEMEKANETANAVWLQVGSRYGRVLDVDENTVFVELLGHPGSRVGIERDLVNPTVIYQALERDMDQDDPEAWVELSTFAKSHDLHSLRVEALKRARELEPGSSNAIDERIEEARADCTRARLTQARKLEEAGETRRAIRYLSDTLGHYDACEATPAVQELLSKLERTVRQEGHLAVARKENQRRMRKGWKRIDDASELMEEGGRYLAAARKDLDDSVDAAHRIHKSVALLQAAGDALDRIPPGLSPDAAGLKAEGYDVADVEREKKRLRLVVQDDLLEARTELGHLYIARGDLQSAREQLGLAAIIDSSDWRVSLLRLSIAAATSEDERRRRRR
jgi:tetratricopeptide (TPR) repeat protein